MKPVEEFVLEKLAIPAWMRHLKGFVKGKPWQAWSGEARAAGKARARQHVTRKALRESAGYERAGLPLLAQKAKAPLQGAMTELGPLVQQVKSPQMRQLLTTPAMQRNLYMQPSMRTTPAMRLREVNKLMEGPLQMGRRQAVRSAAGIGKPAGLGRMEWWQQKALKNAPSHMVPERGQTGAFQSLMARAPTQLQPRFQDIQRRLPFRPSASQMNVSRPGDFI